MSDGPSLFMWGVSHKKAPLQLRERCVLSPEQRTDFEALLKTAGLREHLILSTCNRFEIYAVGGAPPEFFARALERLNALPEGELENYHEQLKGEQAVNHLMRVAGGLDSQMVGETEIFGQVKDAYAAAQAAGATGAVLNRLFQKAFQAAKWVRSHTDISRGLTSVGSVAVDLAERIFGDLEKAHVLVLGAGEVGEKTLAAMRSRGARRTTLASRTHEHALAMAAQDENITAMPLQDALENLWRFDIVIASLAAQQPVLENFLIDAALTKRRFEPMFFIDAAMPRNIELCGELPQAYVYNLDDLSKIANENLASRHKAIEACEKILSQRAEKLWQSLCLRA